jgi:hypothetical protein
MMQLSMKSWNSAFNAQSSRLILVVVQLGAVKICVAAVESIRIKLSLPPKLMLSEFHALLNAETSNWNHEWRIGSKSK